MQTEFSIKVRMCWIPRDVWITGNDKADSAAKYVMCKEIDPNFKIPYTNLKKKKKLRKKKNSSTKRGKMFE